MVVSYHSPRLIRGIPGAPRPQASEAGEGLLQAGGNAADAFVAATLAEYVVAEGGTSLAGTLGALVYHAPTGKIEYLDADYNHVADPKGRWAGWDALVHTFWRDRSGKAVLVPGALGGLEELSSKYGRLGFARALEPAIQLAREGFPISEFYSAVIGWSRRVLKRSEYGRRTFFRSDGHPLRPGDILRQPELAAFLEATAREGSAYMYSGSWSKQCVQAVQSRGGRMSEADLRAWRPAWHEPWTIRYRGYDLHSSSGRQYGGIWVNLALLALEHTDLASLGHFSRSADGLEAVVRTVRETWEERRWFEDPTCLDDREFVRARLTPAYASEIWRRAWQRGRPQHPPSGAGSHSYHIITADAAGSVVTGTNTIQSLPWGGGTFVEGIPLNQTGFLASRSGPGERVVNALTMHLGFRDGRLQLATGAFTNSLLETNLQFLLNLIDYGLPAEEAVSRPRFGTFPHDLRRRIDTESNWLDSDVDASIARTLGERGVRMVQRGALVNTGLDVGLGVAAARRPDGTLEGAVAPWPGLTAPWREVEPVKRRR